MQFWQITHPDYESDYQSSYINGTLEHPYGMPGIECHICHQTWGGSRILPFECPPLLKKHKHIKEGWPISPEEHGLLQQEVQRELKKTGLNCPPLLPGDSFQPCYLDVPSRPQSDFLWAGLGSIVVSQRIKSLFEFLDIRGVFFCPVTFRKIGKRNARLPAPIPSTGEPEDIIKQSPVLAQTDSVGSYFELVIQSKTGYASGTEPLSVCSGCGRKTFPNNKIQFVMNKSMWDGGEIFYLEGPSYRIVTDKLKQSLQELEATNIDFRTF